MIDGYVRTVINEYRDMITAAYNNLGGKMREYVDRRHDAAGVRVYKYYKKHITGEDRQRGAEIDA